MSKVWEDEEIRNATSDEENLISESGGGYDYWELVDTKTITEDTSEYIYTFDSEKYDDVLIVGADVKGTSSIYSQVRFKLSQYTTLSFYNGGVSLSSTNNTNLIFTHTRIFDDIFKNEVSKDNGSVSGNEQRLTTALTFNRENKISSVRINANSGNVIISGTFKIYAKVRSEFI